MPGALKILTPSSERVEIYVNLCLFNTFLNYLVKYGITLRGLLVLLKKL